MPMRENLYFIAIIAPDAVAEEINSFKYDIRDNYNSKAALKTKPHITLKAPFKLPVGNREALFEWFRNIPLSLQPFNILLENFGCFDSIHNPVIFVKPVMSPELIALQSEVITNFSVEYPEIRMSTHEHQFKAHITIAYRDLTSENFIKAWAEYRDKEYISSFLCSSFCLLQHNGLKWEVVLEHTL